MADKSSSAASWRWLATDFAVGQPVRVVGGILADTTGVITDIPDSSDRALKINGWPEGVYVIALGEVLSLEPI